MGLSAIDRSYERLVNRGRVGIRYRPGTTQPEMWSAGEGPPPYKEIEMAVGIYIASEDKLHRGYVDENQRRYTNEQCNLAKANEAGNLEWWYEGAIAPEGFNDLERCELCFPA